MTTRESMPYFCHVPRLYEFVSCVFRVDGVFLESRKRERQGTLLKHNFLQRRWIMNGKLEVLNINGKDYVKPIKLASVVGVPPQYIYQLISQGKMKHEMYIGQKFIPLATAQEFISKRQGKKVSVTDLVNTLTNEEKMELLKKLQETK